MRLKSNFYQMSISRRDLVYLSTPTFLNVELTRAISDLPAPLKNEIENSLKKG